MKSVRWKRFIWDLTKLPSLEAALPSHFSVRLAAPEDRRAATDVIFSSFLSDNSWSDTFKKVRSKLEAEIEQAFESTPIPLMVITHGQRVIAASLLDTAIDAESHLLSGPCVLSEYRSRGLGTALLHQCLSHLQTSGLTRACALCKEATLTAKFIYRKFGSVSEDCDPEPSLVSR